MGNLRLCAPAAKWANFTTRIESAASDVERILGHRDVICGILSRNTKQNQPKSFPECFGRLNFASEMELRGAPIMQKSPRHP
jgi:hypothetical protein